jgi:hypothetical protein
MTPEEIIKLIGNEILSFSYYYKGNFLFSGLKTPYILRGYVKIESIDNDEFELDPSDLIYAKEYQKHFTSFKVHKFKSGQVELVYEWHKPSGLSESPTDHSMEKPQC